MRVVGDQQNVPDCGGKERDSGVFKSIWYQLSVKSATCSRFWICPNHPHQTSVAFHVARVNIKQFFIRVWNYRELCSQLVWEITPIIAQKKSKLWVKFETKWVLFRCLQIILSKNGTAMLKSFTIPDSGVTYMYIHVALPKYQVLVMLNNGSPMIVL